MYWKCFKGTAPFENPSNCWVSMVYFQLAIYLYNSGGGDDDVELHEKLKEIRKRHGFTQKQLANLLDMTESGNGFL